MPVPGGTGPFRSGEFYVPAQDFTAPVSLTSGAGVLSLTGFAPAVAVPRLVLPGVGALVLAGFVPTVTGGGVVPPIVGGIRRPGIRRKRKCPELTQVAQLARDLTPPDPWVTEEQDLATLVTCGVLE